MPTFLLVPFFVLRPFIRERRDLKSEDDHLKNLKSYDEIFYKDNLNLIDETMDLLGVSHLKYNSFLIHDKIVCGFLSILI